MIFAWFAPRTGGDGDTYFYSFSYGQSFLSGYPEWCNGSHLNDLYSVFGEIYFKNFRETILGDFNDDDRAVSDMIMKYYGNFAHTGYA